MSVLQYSKHVNSAQLARVKEVTISRHFEAQNDGEETPAPVVYNTTLDSLFCCRCARHDDCTHTARVRLCGILTGTVKERAGIERVKR